MYDPCEGQKFGRISEKHMFNDNLSAQAKLIITYINGKIGMSPTGKVELKLETVAALIGSKIGKNGKRPTRQASRYITELKDTGIIKTKKGQHTHWVWFKKPDWTDMSMLEYPEVSYMSSLVPATLYKEINKRNNRGAAPDFGFHPSFFDVWDELPFKHRTDKTLVNENVQKHGAPYVRFAKRVALTKNDPPAYFHSAMVNYQSAYLKSPEHAVAGFILENRNNENRLDFI